MFETLESRVLLSAVFTVVNTDESGPGSLRQAIIDANATQNEVDGPDVIEFNIPGAGPHTIVTQGLHSITDSVIIDGFSQPGSSPNTLAEGDNSVHQIVIQGQHNYFADIRGGTTIRGLVFNQWVGIAALRLVGPVGENVIVGNFFGTDVTGTNKVGNTSGIHIEHSRDNRIGGTDPADRNVISGGGTGIQIFANNVTASLEGNVIQGNYFGTNAAGTAAIEADPLNSRGIDVSVPDGVPIDLRIGGSAAGAGNLFSGMSFGIVIASVGQDSDVRIQGNKIGTDRTGTQDIGNEEFGIVVGGQSGQPSGVLIGGPNTGDGNIIAFNGAESANGAGVVISQNGPAFSVGTSIWRNAIFANKTNAGAGPGIDLGLNGETANDAGDADIGPNNFQNFPVITSATQDGPNIDIVGTLSSAPNTSYRVEFFATTATGQTFLGASQISTNGAGEATIDVSFTGTLPVGGDVQATATAPDGSTSELSPVDIEPVQLPDLTVDTQGGQIDLQPGQGTTRQVTVNNVGQAGVNTPVVVRAFASTDGVLDANDPQVGEVTINQPIAAGANRGADVPIDVPANQAIGAYTVFFQVDPAGAVAESNENNNQVSGVTLNVTQQPNPDTVQIGKDSPSGQTKVTRTDADGTAVTFSLNGPGVATIVGGDGATAFSVALTGTTSKSTLSIKTKNGEAVISGVTGDGQASLKAFNAKTSDLAGDFNLPGTINAITFDDVISPGNAADRQLTIGGAGALPTSKVKLKFDNVSDLDINSGILISGLTVDQWLEDATNTDPDVITAPGVATITAKGDKKNVNRGDFSAGLNLTDAALVLKKLSVKGLLDNAVLRSAGDLGAVTVGAARNATVFSGVDTGAPAGALPTAQQLGDNAVKSFAVKGKPEDFAELGGSLVRDLNLAAANFGSVTLSLVDTASGDGTFGVAANTIQSYRRDDTRLANPPLGQNPDVDAEGNFVLRLLPVV